jgi:hypothetical protein
MIFLEAAWAIEKSPTTYFLHRVTPIMRPLLDTEIKRHEGRGV